MPLPDTKLNKTSGYVIGLIMLLAVIAFFYIILTYHKKDSEWSNIQPSNALVSDGTKGPCTAQVLTTIDVYSRPSVEAGLFGHIDVGDKQIIGGRTSDGWLGFDPGVAQAPNVGPFRLRYFQESSDTYKLLGDCAHIPTVVSLPADTCFMMAQTNISILNFPEEGSVVTSTMHVNDYIPVVGKTVGASEYWIKVSNGTYGTIAGASGWISSNDVNFNGETCNDLPIVKG